MSYTVAAKWGNGTGHAPDEMPYVVGALQNAGRRPRGVPSTDEAAGGQLVVRSDLFRQDARNRRSVSAGRVSDFEMDSHDGAKQIVVRSDLDSGKDHVCDLVGVEADVVGDLDVQVNEDGAGHGSSNRDGDIPSISQAGAGRNGWDGDTSSPDRPAPVGVRRLTPTECERLQALPDGWTAHGPDSRRYAALGDAVTSSVAEWIGRRLMEAQ